MEEFKRHGVTYEVLRADNDLNILKQIHRDDASPLSSDYFVAGLLMYDINDWVVVWRFDSLIRATKFFDSLTD